MYEMMKAEEMNEYLSEIMNEEFEKAIIEIYKKQSVNEKIIEKEFLQCLDVLIKDCIKLQKDKKKGRIAGISIFHLKSELLTRKYRLHITAYDSKSYADMESLTTYWYPQFIFSNLTKDLDYMQGRIKNKIIRPPYDKIQEAEMSYASNYNLLALKYCMEKIEKIEELDSFHELEKENNFYVSFGGYMNQQMKIYEA